MALLPMTREQVDPEVLRESSPGWRRASWRPR
jgi:hypothetical protein